MAQELQVSNSNNMQLIAIDKVFGDKKVRFFKDENGDIWAVAKDICDCMNIKNSSDAINNVKEEWKGVVSTETLGGIQNMAIIKEPAIYKLIMRSNKPEAIRFQDWVCGDILPSIRKTGRYEMKQSEPLAIDIDKQIEIAKLTLTIKREESVNLMISLMQKLYPNDARINLAIRERAMSIIHTQGNNEEKNIEPEFEITAAMSEFGLNTKTIMEKRGQVGIYMAKMYKKKYNEDPPKTNKEVNNNIRSVNYYGNKPKLEIMDMMRKVLINLNLIKNSDNENEDE